MQSYLLVVFLSTFFLIFSFSEAQQNSSKENIKQTCAGANCQKFDTVKGQMTCDKSGCRETNSLKKNQQAVDTQAILESLEQVNPSAGEFCSNTNSKSSKFLKDNNFSACSTKDNQHKGLEPLAVTFPVGHPKTPKQVDKVLKASFNENELKALKGRQATAFVYIPKDKFKFERMLKAGDSFASFTYGNDRFPYVSDKIALMIDTVNVPDDQGLTGSGGFGYTKVLNNGIELRIGIDAELRTLRFEETYFKDKNGDKHVDQAGVETTTFSLEALKRTARSESLITTKGLKLQFKNADAGVHGILKGAQTGLHEAQGMPITHNQDIPELNEKSGKVSGSYAFDKFFHTLNSNCLIRVGAKASVGFVVTEDGHVEQSHEAELRASYSRYLPKVGVEASVGANLQLSYHNLSADNFSERSDTDIMGFETIPSVDLGLRKGNFAVLFDVSINENGIDQNELYYQATGRYYFKAPTSSQQSVVMNLTGKSSDINKTQLVRTFQ